jgi:hypothetical protein
MLSTRYFSAEVGELLVSRPVDPLAQVMAPAKQAQAVASLLSSPRRTRRDRNLSFSI